MLGEILKAIRQHLKHPTSVRVTLKGNALILVEVYKYKSQIYKTDIRTHICKQRKNNNFYFIKANTCYNNNTIIVLHFFQNIT